MVNGNSKDMKDGNMKIESYDLSKDLKEAQDISDKHPEVVAQIEVIMAKEHKTPQNPKFNLPID